MSAAEKFANASDKFTEASKTIETYASTGTNEQKKTILNTLKEQISDGIEAMIAGLNASAAAPGAPGAPAAGGSKNKKNNKDKDNKDKKSKNNR
jgi:hypothetical protein